MKSKPNPKGVSSISMFFQQKFAIFRQGPRQSKPELPSTINVNLDGNNVKEIETPKVIRKSRLNSWLGESAENASKHEESADNGQNGPDSKEMSGLALDSIHTDDSQKDISTG